MKRFILEVFGETGDISMMRLLSFICVLTASAIAMKAVVYGSDLNATAVLCSVFLSSGIAGKVIQRGVESKDERK